MKILFLFHESFFRVKTLKYDSTACIFHFSQIKYIRFYDGKKTFLIKYNIQISWNHKEYNVKYFPNKCISIKSQTKSAWSVEAFFACFYKKKKKRRKITICNEILIIFKLYRRCTKILYSIQAWELGIRSK